ncbi:hypothetical protein I5M27_13780 [Adhaeribacter sp. BT258]|uniref:Lipoprotein n=1 Tax=Adhaeribacter terrigena TaxID=2793070 RepID=A0ABS1C661_9BACT|nr:hypothetical protein [Adhaeribacter terrigena]MBK0404060.1 hypothetical protein [Adhaeribacter terrigena]
MRKLFSFLVLLLTVTLLVSACSRSPYKNRKAPKAGKPIPCPMKDC